jgi:DNA-binding response OmpR family regulator
MVRNCGCDEDPCSMKVLIVDDSELIRTALMRLVANLPAAEAFTVITAGTLAQAFESARREKPAFMVLDMHLPDGNALQVIEPLKRHLPEMVIAIFTAFPSKMHEATCRKAGADWFLDKASDVHVLLDLLVRHAMPDAFPGA